MTPRALPFNLNERAWQLCDALEGDATRLQIAVTRTPAGTRVFDCSSSANGYEVGQRLSQICLADLGDVSIRMDEHAWPQGVVHVETQQPVIACMASQYAGWKVSGEKYFAMGSGPMRAVAARETLFEELNVRERAERIVGVLETSKLPPDAICIQIAEQCGVTPDNLTLLVARTASQAGTVQIVARSVETALHKLHGLGFDLWRITAGTGQAPLPPVAASDIAAIGRTNDAILYGGEVSLIVTGDDESLLELGPQIPSNASRDFGEPFSAIFERYDRDFYKIDPLLFSPALVRLINADTGRTHSFGELRPDVLHRSFAE